MIHITDDNAIRATPTVAFDKFSRLLTWIVAALEERGRFFHKVEAAHASRCDRENFSEKEFQDTGIDPSDATGIPSWQPDLPFFMQGGCGRE
jgi:hypothetical protein